MCNENVNENAQIRPVCDAKIEADIAEQERRDWEVKRQMALARRRQKMPKSEIISRLAEENIALSRNIERLENFLKDNPELFASEKQIELMRGQLKAMESYKFYLSCHIADLALSDFEPSEEKKGA